MATPTNKTAAFGGYAKSLVFADKPQTLDHLEDNVRRVIADIRPQMLEKVIENWTSRLDYIRASRGSPMPKIIFKIEYTYLTAKESTQSNLEKVFLATNGEVPPDHISSTVEQRSGLPPGMSTCCNFFSNCVQDTPDN
ncbi:hypothetical protein TNCV_4647711 [Trichonephila clavipes]|uniref:Uncharacterized protein n=1 Tax=Trichonephila clavipes TaxID=2585209 RepID=A0A8X6VRT2_TRICX|nr:hypothetical protein TNCV_4647711 [Trichonephila clavipes]